MKARLAAAWVAIGLPLLLALALALLMALAATRAARSEPLPMRPGHGSVGADNRFTQHQAI